MGFFVPNHSIDNLKLYKYQSEDRSILSNYVLKPFWRKFSEIFPLWMAPNLVTLSGLAFIIANVLTVLYFDPTLTQESPRWTYFSYALGLFLYQTFDACDGMHARRTGQSGPLGELFDHCIDSLNTTLSLLPFWSAIGMGYNYFFLVSQCICLTNFYLSTWEEFHTHKLFLSEFCGPVEGVIILCFSFLVTGIWGQQLVWHTTLFEINGIEIEVIHLTFLFMVSAVILNIVTALKNVKDYYVSQSGKDESQVKKEIAGAMDGLMPFAVYFISVFNLAAVDIRFINLPLVLSIGLTMAFVVGRIIVAHLTKQPFPMFNAPMAIPSIQLVVYLVARYILKYDSVEITKALTWLGCGVAGGIHFMFINEIVFEFTTFLDCYALSIKHPKKV
ncbi:diacylglycerol cholinephosphotransferase KNAG_0I02230 [Huiozyma naganishii CBS 8797]|uniref:diacylglycerol cholinephosphotransferase n=1 Tax=Huiozyma naganishii (strain ATCC MYA-139 / BCRC 22969 / CBS 8797 / KCTC 17520 / NBRC 10181 / NCYC 3082 / Yp74L-3) TaxID=1071383 RepID=J7S9C4_HUIN7|nr:hypothetical protein KNAG_0I02230 [Kazachstania naganishii CBS 8797]CCK72009.1 hypothetical protein KNAG_0I02230 [Kazachstania naganishii CBS 8797]